MLWIYKFVLMLTPIVARIAALRSPKARKWIDGQKSLLKQLSERVAAQTKPLIWIHASSLGEYEQARTVIVALKKQYPGYGILATFFSSSGYEARKNDPTVDCVSYLPLDSKQHAEQFILKVRPVMALFVRYDLWYFYLEALHQNKIPCFLISAHFYQKSAYFKWYGTLQRQMLRYFTYVYTTDAATATNLQRLGIPALELGDTRFDRVLEVYHARKEINVVAEFIGTSKVLVLGSTWNEDLTALAEMINDESFLKQHNLKIIIAPRYLDAASMAHLERCITIPKSYFVSDAAIIPAHQVLVLNTTGLLSSVYAYATVAFVGCSFAKGLHNTLEPGVYGIPVFFGPKYTGSKDKDPDILIEKGGMFVVQNAIEARALLVKLLTDQAFYSKAGTCNGDYINRSEGATARVVAHIAQIVQPTFTEAV